MTAPGDTGEPAAEAPPERIVIEPRWPMALAVVAFLALTVTLRIVLPNRQIIGPNWLVPVLEGVLLILLLAADPAHIGRRSKPLRRISIAMVLLLAGIALLSTIVLIVDLVEGGPLTNSAKVLLASGALIWLGNILVFSLIYWLLDSGGPLARYRRERTYPDFAFPQHQSPELAPPDWRAHYVDYLILGLTTSTAFSPTDVLPMARWAKLAMALQSLISLLTIGLVIARAVNIFQ
jgi:uncharacterized membrane protein